MILAVASVLDPGAAAQTPGPTALNHAYVVLDSVTFEAVRTSEFLRKQFAISYQPRDSAVSERSRHTLYLTGRQTYLELFGPGAMAGPIGFTGIAYGFDEPGRLEWAQGQWEGMLGVSLLIFTRTFTRADGSEGVWFRSVSIPPAADTTDPGSIGVWTWAMEYGPEFLRDRLGDPEEAPFVTRERHNRAVVALRRLEPDRPLEDIVGLTLALPLPRADSFLAELAAVGFLIAEDGEGHAAQGNGFQIRVVPQEQGGPGLKAIRFRLIGPISSQQHVIGNSTLDVHPDGTAIWTLAPPVR